LLDRNAKLIEQVAEELQRQRDYLIVTAVVDVCDETGVEQAFQSAIDAFSRIDYVVNCAGIVVKYGELSATLQTEDFDRTINVKTCVATSSSIYI
jgi:NAD(P)-dependent dehydrogenase (short-subunit alcohol dehydrogenase family)